MRTIRFVGYAAGVLALSGCALVLGIEEQTYEGAGASGGAGGATTGSGGAGGASPSTSSAGGAGGISTITSLGGAGGVGGATTASGGAGGTGGATTGSGGASTSTTSAGGGGTGGSECSGATCSLPNATGMCAAGICKINQCALHYEDCDSVDANGCEVSLWTDTSNCNGCGVKCDATGGTASCVSGACKIACSDGYANCDGKVSNGCEVALWTDTSNCNGCGVKCDATGGTASCVSGACKIACSYGHANCDGKVSNGCEVSLWTDPSNCNGCGVTCTNGHGTTACVSGACTPACSSGYGNCDGDAANGCETDTTSNAHCGACGNACTGGAFCSGGTCIAPSCVGGATGQVDCGPGSESCCTSLAVPGGTVQLDGTHSATVSAFKLDKYEVTVGRFRKFVDAWVGGWRPAAGAGKHVHLNGGQGLSNGSGGFEPGWDPAWSTSFKATKVAWDGELSCHTSYQTWTSEAGANERRPITCATWFEQYAFCIWDGGFLPSEAEWQYAAAGGSEGRKYPWGATDPGANANLAVYGCYFNGTGSCSDVTNIAPVGSVAAGNGKWGHADLAGNVWEWMLDWYATPYPLSASTNYVNVTTAAERVRRGGSFIYSAGGLRASGRDDNDPAYRSLFIGARCSRTAP
jgi:formylglycine-generating enzyme required for sulfatase activity